MHITEWDKNNIFLFFYHLCFVYYIRYKQVICYKAPATLDQLCHQTTHGVIRVCFICLQVIRPRGTSGGARKFFLPGHYRGTTISNGAHLMTCTETAIGHANPGLFSNPYFRFQSLPPIQHAFFVGCADSLALWVFSCDLYKFI